MREILFRGKRLDNGEWVFGYFCEFANNRTGEQESYIQTVKQDGRIDLIHKVDPSTVCQFTGLLDKNGKRIFEGDVFAWGCAGVYDMRYVVSYDAETASFIGVRKHGFLSLSGITIEIIGNINDNPELMEGGGSDG
jgi:uncharacterized phage protein (TIGR01671 family)